MSGRYGCFGLWKPCRVWGAGRRGREEEGLASRDLECQAQDVGIRNCGDFLETAPWRKGSLREETQAPGTVSTLSKQLWMEGVGWGKGYDPLPCQTPGVARHSGFFLREEEFGNKTPNKTPVIAFA